MRDVVFSHFMLEGSAELILHEEIAIPNPPEDCIDTNPGKTIYVIAAWSGNRRDNYPLYVKDRTHYLRLHLKKLSQLQHNLSEILIVSPDNPYDESKAFNSFLDTELPSAIGSATISVLRRHNMGMSYGSYSDAFKSETDAGRIWDWWILMEDDHIPVLDHFDSILKNCFRRKPNCGALWGHVSRGPGPTVFPVLGCVSCGITTGSIMQEVWDKHGILPHRGRGMDYSAPDQVEFTRAFIIGGKDIYGLNHEYQVATMWSHRRILAFTNDRGLPLIFAPLQRQNICGFKV